MAFIKAQVPYYIFRFAGLLAAEAPQNHPCARSY